MRKSAKIITALSVTGLAVVAGSAFTGAGLTASDDAAKAQFIGGTVTQTVTGAVVKDIQYKVSGQNTSNTTVTGAVLTFASEIVAGSAVEATFGSATTIKCDPVLPAEAPAGTETKTYDCVLAQGVASVSETAITVTANKNVNHPA